jgi:16S rRNA (guanine527-N7)-methyltransferase
LPPDQQLSAGAAALGLSLPAAAIDKLLRYLSLLQKWNRVYNLTAIREPSQMVTHHLLDSLAIVPFIVGRRLLDVGSGAGLPGVVIAAAMPDVHCILLDSVGKKTRFLTQVGIELKLDNLEVVQQRIEDYRPDAPFDTIVSRAFAELADFISVAAPLLAEGGRLLAMKSARAEQEAQALRSAGTGEWAVSSRSLSVPGLDAARCIVTAERRQPSAAPAAPTTDQ